jgi:hypothetical protein
MALVMLQPLTLVHFCLDIHYKELRYNEMRAHQQYHFDKSFRQSRTTDSKLVAKPIFFFCRKENGIKLDVKYPGSAYVAWIKLAQCGSSGGSFDPCNATMSSKESVQYPDHLNV